MHMHDTLQKDKDNSSYLTTYNVFFSVHVLRESDLPLEVISALGPDVQFVLKYVDIGKWKHFIVSTNKIGMFHFKF